MSAKAALFVVLAAVGVAFCVFWYRHARAKWGGWPTLDAAGRSAR